MQFSLIGRRYLMPTPLPVLWGLYVYPLAALGIWEILSRSPEVGIFFMLCALGVYILAILGSLVVLGDKKMRYSLFRTISRKEIQRVWNSHCMPWLESVARSSCSA